MPYNLLELAIELNYNPNNPESKIKFWGIVFILSNLQPIINFKGKRVSRESIWKEMHEALFEHIMYNPRTENDFLFWAWQSKKYDGQDYDHDWELRYRMLEYHCNKGFAEGRSIPH